MNARTMLDGQFLEGVCEDRQRIVIVKMELTVFFFSERDSGDFPGAAQESPNALCNVPMHKGGARQRRRRVRLLHSGVGTPEPKDLPNAMGGGIG